MEFDATQAMDISLSDDSEPHSSKNQQKKPVAQLKVTAHDGQEEQLHMLYTGENVIGRRSESHITIPAKTISKRHAIIEITNGVHMIHDLGSINKTRRGKILLKPDVRYEVLDGDVLRFGDVVCVYTKITKHVIASDSDTDPECMVNEIVNEPSPESVQELPDEAIEAPGSSTGTKQGIKKPSSLTNSINESCPASVSAQHDAEESNSDAESECLIRGPVQVPSHGELNNNVNHSKLPPKERMPVAASRDHMADFMKTGIILSDSECSESDEELPALNVLPTLQVPETPACEIKPTSNVLEDSSPAIVHKRHHLNRLISSSDSDTDIDDEIKAAKSATVPVKETNTNSGGADAPGDLSDLLIAETQIYSENVPASDLLTAETQICSENASASDLLTAETQLYPEDVVASKLPITSEKQKAVNSPMKVKPTIVPVGNNIDWLELSTQPYPFEGGSNAKVADDDDDAVTRTTKSVTLKDDECAGRKDVDESDDADWASMATQPYIMKKPRTELPDTDVSEVDIYDAATQLYPASELQTTTEKLVFNDSDNEDENVTCTVPAAPTKDATASRNESDEMVDLARADTVPIELIECEGAKAKKDVDAQKPESEEAIFTSPPCTDEETIKLKEKIVEVLASPALALSQEATGGSTECPEKTPTAAFDQDDNRESPLPRKDEERKKTKVTKRRAPAGRMSSRRRKGESPGLADAETKANDIAEGPSSALQTARKSGGEENVAKDPEASSGLEKPKGKTTKAGGAKPTAQNEDLASGPPDKSPSVIGPTPPSGPRTRRSTASKYRRAPAIPESDSSDNSQELYKRRQSLRGSALKKMAAAEMTPKDVKRPRASNAAQRRAALRFESSDDDDFTGATEDPVSKQAEDSSKNNVAVASEAPISESQWQRLEEEIAELSGEGKPDRTSPTSGVAAVPCATELPVPADGKRKSYEDSTDVPNVGTAPTAAVDVRTASTAACAPEEKVVQLQETEVLAAELNIAAEGKSVKKSKVMDVSALPGPPADDCAVASMVFRATGKLGRSRKTLAQPPQPEVTENDVADQPSTASTSTVEDMSEPEVSPPLPVSEPQGLETVTNRRGRSRKTPAKRPRANKLAESEERDAGVANAVEQAEEVKLGSLAGTSTGAPRLQNVEADAKDLKSNLRQSKLPEESSKRVSWSQETNPAAGQSPEVQKKAGRTRAGTKSKADEDPGAVKQPEGKVRGKRSAVVKAPEDAGTEEKLDKKTKAGRSSTAGDGPPKPDAKELPVPRLQRKSTSLYRRLVITADSAVDTADTDYESEASPQQKAAPAKRVATTQRRGKKQKAELNEGACPESAETSNGKSPPKRATTEQTGTPAKRRRGPAASQEPAVEDPVPIEASSSSSEGKRKASTKPKVTKRSRASKLETPVAPVQDSDTESMDEFEPKLLSPPRNARGRMSVATKKTPQKKGAATPEPAPKATPRRGKGSPRAQPKDEAEAVPKIMFTGISEKSLEKIVKELNGSLVDSVFECTHLVTDKVRRTWKFLCMLARGCHIVSPAWLKQCKTEKAFIDAAPYVISDVSAEKQYKFSLQESLMRARNESFLNGYRIHATKSVKPPPQEMQTIIKCAGGTYLARMPTSGENTVVVTCPEDVHLCTKARHGGVAVVGTEFILTGVLRHVVEINTYRC